MAEETGQVCGPEDMCTLQARLEAARERLADAYKMASLGRLVAGIVHEINTPIGSILSNNQVISRSLEKLAGLIGDPGSDRASAGEIVETLRSLAAVDKLACERITSVIRGLRTFSRVDTSELRKADLNEILKDTLKLTQCEYRRRVTVETDLGELPEVECYPHLLNQVFLNVLVNAGQAIEGEGRVTVRTRREDGRVRVSISDTGRGIQPEHRAKIFSAGFTTKPVGEGTGLGLSISRSIVVERHGGAMDFESEPGKGTTFHIVIPMHPPKRAG